MKQSDDKEKTVKKPYQVERRNERKRKVRLSMQWFNREVSNSA
jgi:hypothetical protein